MFSYDQQNKLVDEMIRSLVDFYAYESAKKISYREVPIPLQLNEPSSKENS